MIRLIMLLSVVLAGCVIAPIPYEYREPIVPTVVIPVYRSSYYVYEQPIVVPGYSWRKYYR